MQGGEQAIPRSGVQSFQRKDHIRMDHTVLYMVTNNQRIL